MKVNDFGDFIKYLRNEIIERPSENYEGDDLKIEIYDNELAIRINDLYDGPTVIYCSNNGKIETIFYKTEPDVEKNSVSIPDNSQIKVTAALINLIEENKEMLDNFLGRKDNVTMRDINRIDAFCDRLKKVWKENPDQRFFQLINNIISHYDSDMYYREDDEAIDMIEKAMGKVKTKVTSENIKSNAIPQLLQELKEIKEDIKRIYENQEKGMK